MADPTQMSDRDAMAAELALGLLDGDERAAALRLQLSDPDFADAVEDWRERFAPLSAGFASSSPPAALWAAIEARLGRDAQPSEVAAIPLADTRQLGRWRAAAIGSSAVAAVLLAAIILRPAPEPVMLPSQPTPVVVERPVVIAQLAGEPGGALLAARYSAEPGELTIRASGMSPGDLAPVLWVIPDDGVPRSLGLVAADGTSRVVIPAVVRPLIADGATLAVTLEPTDGAPYQAPTSTPIAAGTISTI